MLLRNLNHEEIEMMTTPAPDEQPRRSGSGADPYPAESFGIDQMAKHMAWQFAGQCGPYAESVPPGMEESVRRALALSYYRIELVQGGPVAEFASNVAAVALLAAYERLTGQPLNDSWEATVLHFNTASIPREELLDLAAKAMLSASLRPEGIDCGEAYQDDKCLRWDIVDHHGKPTLALTAPTA